MVIFAQIILNRPFQTEQNFLLHRYKSNFDLFDRLETIVAFECSGQH